MKKIISLFLSLVMCVGTFPTVLAQYDGPIIYEKSFSGLSEFPSDWSITGATINDDCISVTEMGGVVEAYYENEINSDGDDYMMSFKIGHQGDSLTYAHFGCSSPENAVSASVDDGYAITYGAIYNNGLPTVASVKLYKNGNFLGELEDLGGDWSYQGLREYKLTITDSKLILSGANNSIEIEDNEPIYSGYAGFRLFTYTPQITKLSHFGAYRMLDVENSGVSDFQSVTETITTEFNMPVNEDAANSDNIYILDSLGEKVEDVSVSADGANVNIVLDKALEYDKKYTLYLKKDILDATGKVTMADKQEFEFTTEKAPFSIKSTVNTNTVDLDVYNTVFDEQDFYAVVLLKDNDTVVESQIAELTMPQSTQAPTKSVPFATDLAGKEIEIFALDADLLPLLVNEPQKLDAQKPGVETSENNAIISGVDPSGEAGNIYVIIKERDSELKEQSQIKAVHIQSGENGRYTATIPMSGVGYYTAIVTGDCFKESKSVDFYFADTEIKNTAIGEFNKAYDMEETEGIAHIGACIEEYAEELSLNAALLKLIVDNGYSDTVSKKLYTKIKAKKLSLDGGKEIQGVFVEAAAVTLAQNGKLADIMSIVDFYTMDTENQTTAAYIYNNNLKETGKANVADAVAKTEYSDLSGVYKSFVEAVVVEAINSWNEEGYSHITDVLYKNGEFAGLSLTAYKSASDKPALNEYIFSVGINSISELQTAINEAYLSSDKAYYTHTFTTADLGEDSEWTIDLSIYGELTDENGILIDPEKGKSGNSYTYSKFDMTGDYELSGTFRRDWNQQIYYFSYIDKNNYCYAEMRYSSDTDQHTVVGRVVNGVKTEYARVADGTTTGVSVVVEEDGYVSVKNVRGEYTIPRTYLGSALEGGKVGIGLEATVGYIKTVNILTYLNAETNLHESGVDIDTNKFKLTFNFPVKGVGKDTVKLFENGKEITDFNISENADMQNYDITLGSKLNYKSRYELVISSEIEAYVGKSKFLKDKSIVFLTEAPPLNVTFYKGTIGADEIFINDITLPDEKYTSIKALSEYKNQNMTLTLDISNSEKKAFIAVFELTDENGKALWSEIKNVSGNDTEVTATLTVPQNVTDSSRFNYFIFDSKDGLHTLYPYTNNTSLGTGDMPVVSKVGNSVLVSGKTVSKSANKRVNAMLVSDADEVVKTDSVYTNETGEYSFELVINPDLISDSCDLSVYLGGEEYEKALVSSVYYADADDRNSAVNDINKRTDTMAAIEEYKYVLDLGSDNKNGICYYDELTDKQKLASMLEAKKPFNETDNGASFTETALRYALILNYNAGNEDVLFGENGEFLGEDIISFAEETKNIYKIYSENLTENGKKLVRDNLMNRNCASVEELCKVFAQNVVAYGINNWTQNGYGHISSLLTDYQTETEINLTKYNSCTNKGAFEQSLINNTVSSFSDLQSRINAIVNQTRPSGSSGGGGGGTVSSGEIKNTLPFDISASSTPVPQQPDEESGYEWAKTAIDYLIENNIAEGYDDGTFKPGRDITREEFVKLIVGAFGISEGENTLSFTDVKAGAWYEPYIKAAASKGVVEGYDDGSFGVGRTIKRQEAIVMLSRILELNGTDTSINENPVAGFSDANEVSEYAISALNYFVSQGMISGVGNNRLAPLANCKRAEMAQMLYNVLNRESIAPNVSSYSYQRAFTSDNTDVSEFELNEGYTLSDNGIENTDISNVLLLKEKETQGKYEYSVKFKAPFENNVRLLFNYIDEKNYNYIEIQPDGAKASLKTVCEDKLYTGGLYDLGIAVEGDEWIEATVVSNGGREVSLTLSNSEGEFEVFAKKYLENGSEKGYIGFDSQNNPLAIKELSLNIYGNADYTIPEFNMPNDEGQISDGSETVYDESIIELMCGLGIMKKTSKGNDPTGYIAKDEMLEISKQLKSYFEPGDTYASNADALEMIFTALHCQMKMTEEQRYAAALSMGLLDKTSYKRTGNITRYDMAQIIYNAFSTNMLDRETGKLMEVVLKLEKIKGQLTDSGITALTSKSTVGTGNIMIADKKLVNKAGSYVSGFIGRMVEAYYNEEGEALYVRLQKDEKYLTINAEDIEEFSNGRLSYVHEGTGRIKNVSVKLGASLIINGESVTSYDDTIFEGIEDGYITLIASDTSNYDTIVAESYRSFVVGSVMAEKSVIYNKAHSASDDGNRQYTLELSKYEAIDIIDENGNSVTISDIEADDVLSVAESENYVKIYISKQLNNSFTVSTIENSDGKTVIGSTDKKYTISSYYDEIRDKADIKVGETYILYINHFGKVAWAKDAQILSFETGVLADVYLEESEDSLILKVYETDGEIKKLKTDTKIRFRDDDGVQSDYSYSGLYKRLKGVNEIISYKSNSEDEVIELELPYDGYIANSPSNLMKIADVEEGAYTYKMSAYAFGYKYFFTRVKRMFSVDSNNTTDLDSYSNISSVWDFGNTDSYKMKCYSTNSSYLVDYAIMYDFNDKSGPPRITSKELLVRSVLKTIDDNNEEVYQLNVNIDTVLLCEPEAAENIYDMFGYKDKNGTKYTLSEGDIIKYKQDDATGKVSDIIMIYDNSAINPETGTNGYLAGATKNPFAVNREFAVLETNDRMDGNRRYFYGWVYSNEDGVLEVTTQDLGHYGDYYLWNDPNNQEYVSECYTLEQYDIATAKLNDETGKWEYSEWEWADQAEIRPFKTYGNNCSRVLICSSVYDDNYRMIILN